MTQTHVGLQAEGGRDEAKLARDGVRLAAFGHACWLMGRSGVHRHLFFSDADWLLMPPIILNQYRLWVRNGLPFAFASWAHLAEVPAQRMASGIVKLAPADWKSGADTWLVDFVAPFGGEEELARELKAELFPETSVKTLKSHPSGGMHVGEL